MLPGARIWAMYVQIWGSLLKNEIRVHRDYKALRKFHSKQSRPEVMSGVTAGQVSKGTPEPRVTTSAFCCWSLEEDLVTRAVVWVVLHMN